MRASRKYLPSTFGKVKDVHNPAVPLKCRENSLKKLFLEFGGFVLFLTYESSHTIINYRSAVVAP